MTSCLGVSLGVSLGRISGRISGPIGVSWLIPSSQYTMAEVESSKKACKKFYKKLIEALPMNDLITGFHNDKLLPGNHKAIMESLSTKREKAQYFLDEVIKPGLHIGYIGQFSKMIDVMESSDDPVVKYLVKQIQEYMLVASPSSSDDNDGM